jgi:hypothetical protein
MSTAVYFTSAKLRQRLHEHEGPLDLYIDLYVTRLLNEGHGRRSAQRCLQVVGDFNHWLARKQLRIGNVNEIPMPIFERPTRADGASRSRRYRSNRSFAGSCERHVRTE